MAIWLILITSAANSADCTRNASKLESGAVAPCSGWLFSPSYTQETAKNIELIQNKEQQIQALGKLQVLTESEVEFYKVRSQNLAKEYSKAENKAFWSNLGFFALGVVITGIAAKTAIESTK